MAMTPISVVAADKALPPFPNSNAISNEKSHWLGEAFALRRQPGMTTRRWESPRRGAWESVNAISRAGT